MKTQTYNEGELSELKVNIEKQLVEDLKVMSENTGMPIEDLVAVALKRFRTHHADYMGVDLDYP